MSQEIQLKLARLVDKVLNEFGQGTSIQEGEEEPQLTRE